MDDAIGKIGIWTFQLDHVSVAEGRDAMAELEDLGYGAVWIPEAVGRDPLVQAALLLEGGSTITLATGIASLWARDAMAMAAGQKTVDTAYPRRFLLGIGVSHQPMVERVRGQEYVKPFSAMGAYLDAMDRAPYFALQPEVAGRRVLAALGPKMLGLARDRSAGAHPYFVPPEHTAFAREVLGDGPLLAPEQAVIIETDPERARALARAHMAIYLGLPNYANNVKRFGFTDDDLADGGSDKLVDAIVAWGDIDAVVARVRQHQDAGADHVCVQVLNDSPGSLPRAAWRELAAALID